MTDPTNRDEPGAHGVNDGAEAPSAEATPDSAEVASTSVDEHDEHRGLVESGTDRAAARANEHDDWQRSWNEAGGGEIEPTIIAPSTLRGPSHDAEATSSSLEQPGIDADSARTEEPPALVEPERPSLRLNSQSKPDLTDTAPFAGLGAAGAAGAAASASADQPTVATPAVASEDAQGRTQVMPTVEEPQFEVAPPATAATQQLPTEQERRGSIDVDDETARAAATGTPIVLVETPTPPRKKGARGVGFAVVLLSTLIFGALLAAGFLAVGYLFDRDFVLQETLQTLWLRPSWLLPVAVFFVAYWIVTLVVNRAGWWAHVLGAFIVAVLTYAAHVAGAFLETQSSQWDVFALSSLGVDDLPQLLLAPLSVLTFVLAREVPVWFGGIVARRGRKAKEYNRTALADYERENAEKIAAYERARG